MNSFLRGYVHGSMIGGGLIGGVMTIKGDVCTLNGRQLSKWTAVPLSTTLGALTGPVFVPCAFYQLVIQRKEQIEIDIF